MWRGLQAKLITRRSLLEIVAMVLSVSWIVSIGLFFFYFPPRPKVEDDFHSLWFILILIVMLMPVAMIWVAATTSHSVRILKEESSRLHAVIDGMSKAYTDNTAGSINHSQPNIEAKPKEVARATSKTENTLSTFASSRLEQKLSLTQVHVISNNNQTTLALGTSSEDVLSPLSNADLIRALNFPDNEKDARAICSLGLALKDRNARQLVQASQDILILMSQDGIYMDNLYPDLACSMIWRKFAKGERGIAMGALGGIRDSASLAVTTGRMREDTIFRDAAHHFLRRFDQTFIMFEPNATDEEISELSETRTARAFMLLGRITGAFD